MNVNNSDSSNINSQYESRNYSGSRNLAVDTVNNQYISSFPELYNPVNYFQNRSIINPYFYGFPNYYFNSEALANTINNPNFLPPSQISQNSSSKLQSNFDTNASFQSHDYSRLQYDSRGPYYDNYKSNQNRYLNEPRDLPFDRFTSHKNNQSRNQPCLLYTSDAADE